MLKLEWNGIESCLLVLLAHKSWPPAILFGTGPRNLGLLDVYSAFLGRHRLSVPEAVHSERLGILAGAAALPLRNAARQESLQTK